MKTSQKLLIITISMMFLLSLASIIVIKNVVKNNVIFGSGKIITNKVTVKSFNELSLKGNITVHWKKSDSLYVSISIDESLLKQIEVNSANNVLEIKGPGIFRKTKTMIIVYSPDFQSIILNDGSILLAEDTLYNESVTINSNNGSEAKLKICNRFISIDANNGSSIRINGKSDKVTVKTNNGSSVKIDHLSARVVDTHAFSGSSVNVIASDSITGNAESGSSIDVFGNPKYKQVHADESSSINQ